MDHHSDLRSFLQLLRSEGEVVEVDVEVDPRLELPEIHRRVIASGGPALLFRRPRHSSFPVLTNLFGTRRRVDLAFGDHPHRFVQRMASLPDELFPLSAGRIWKQRDLIPSLWRMGVKRRSGPVAEVQQRPPDLTTLPALTTWEKDGGPFITLPLVYTEDPLRGGHNLGMYRMQRFDESHCGMHWQIGKGGGFHYHQAEKEGRALPVNVFLGGPIALILAAVAPLPENVPELMLASLLAKQRISLMENPHGPLPLVSEAEFCLVGEVPPGERRPEGPFGDHYGYYSLRHDYPVFHCKAMFHRKDAIYPATVVGKPRQEDFYIGDYLQELLSPLFPRVMPAVRDLWSYGETGYHSLAAAVVRQRYPREAMASAFRILGEGQLSLTKFLLVLDDARDLRDFRGTLEHVLARFDPQCDLFVFSPLAMDTLDYNGPAVNEGSKGVLLGLGDSIRELPRVFEGNLPRGFTRAEVFCPGCLVLSGPAHAVDPQAAQRAAEWEDFSRWPLIVVADDAKDAVRTETNFLWTTFTRFEPAADLHARAVELKRLHPSFTLPLVLDARLKPGFPEELFCDEETARRVDERWNEYFPQGGVIMGDSARAHLDAR